MTEEFNLSEKRIEGGDFPKDKYFLYYEEDVKEFIRRLKEMKIWVHDNETNQECYCITINDLNKLAGGL